ncbi:DUF4202 family protein [candidate division WWE3 bacterium]|uniref:DUF4202 family protein n=1 Tax=candidate division WWE3 bacterium TaxID=2053526 RepID=A0A955J277_UNCKA|nr:DUF4202 family protein [candidate division WWE3 bacterium]
MDNTDYENLVSHLEDIMYPTKELAHGRETRDWLLTIAPESTWQLQIAALTHDIERAVPYIEGMTPKKPQRTSNYDEYKQEHAKRSANIVGHILNTFNIKEKDIKLITDIIEKHEIGGYHEVDLVRDADSIRWFDEGYKQYTKAYGIPAAKEKGWWMYKRATQETKDLINSLSFDSEIKDYIKQQESI